MNVKAGLNLSDEFNLKMDDIKSKYNLNPCASLGAEYLIPVEHLFSNLDLLKFGVGVKYLLPTYLKRDKTVKEDSSLKKLEFSQLPIYFIFQINPFVSGNGVLKGIFVKGDIGYNAYLSSHLKDALAEYPEYGNINVKGSGDLYYAFGAGYEFPFGLIFDVSYCEYKLSAKSTFLNLDEKETIKSTFTYKCIGLNVGYKFKM